MFLIGEATRRLRCDIPAGHHLSATPSGWSANYAVASITLVQNIRQASLGRNVAVISALMESDVEFVAADNPHASRLMLHLLAAFAEHEREMISQRTKAAL